MALQTGDRFRETFDKSGDKGVPRESGHGCEVTFESRLLDLLQRAGKQVTDLHVLRGGGNPLFCGPVVTQQ